MNKLFEAVEKKNVAEVEEILKQCTPEILEFRAGGVSIFSSLICCTNKSKILLFCSWLARYMYAFLSLPFSFAKGSIILFNFSLMIPSMKYFISHN